MTVQTTSIKPTQEQLEIITFVENNPTQSVMINALAGSAKTTTLSLLSFPPGVPILALAFNKKAKEDLAEKLPQEVQVKTLNGLGHGVWRQTIRRNLTLDRKKIGKIISALAPDTEHWKELLSAVNMARNAGLVPKSRPGNTLIPDTLTSWQELLLENEIDLPLQLVPLARQALCQSITQGFQGIIDFQDQLYMPTCFSGHFPQFHTVLVDEAQDLSLLNHKMISLLRAKRIIAVGDPYQAIYAWRGAHGNSMARLQQRFNTTTFNLTTCFRCSAAVVQLAQTQRVPNMKVWSQSPQGQVLFWPKWTAQDIAAKAPATIICRNNSPLFSMAYRLLRQAIPVRMLGTDIGRALQATLTKVVGKKAQKTLPVSEIMRQLSIWRREQTELAENLDKPYLKDRADDRFMSYSAIIEGSKVETLAELQAEIQSLFSNERAKILLSTGHKAKGQEWTTVFHLDPWRIPSKYAKRSAKAGNKVPLEQEKNLHYVITTRAKLSLIHIDLDKEVRPA